MEEAPRAVDDKALSTPFTYQDGMSDKVPSPLESTHSKGNHDKETDNLTVSTARRIFKGKSQSPSPAVTAVEGKLAIASAAGRSIKIYGNKKESGEEGEKSSSPEDVSLSLEQGDHGLSTRARGDDESGRRRSRARSKDKSRDKKSTDGQAVLTLTDMTVSSI